MSNIIVENLRKYYGDLKVLDDFSCVFKEGQWNIIVGRSGAGKTSLIRILMGLEMPDSGRIDGMKKEISPIFQENRLLEAFSVYDNIRYVAGDQREFRIDQVLYGLGLEDKKHSRVESLSGGMKRRVEIAKALLKDSSTYVFDEPFKDMDDTTYREVLDFSRKELEGKTVIMTSHRLEEVEFFQGRIIEMPY